MTNIKDIILSTTFVKIKNCKISGIRRNIFLNTKHILYIIQETDDYISINVIDGTVVCCDQMTNVKPVSNLSL